MTEKTQAKTRWFEALNAVKSLEARCLLSIFGIKGIGFGLMSPWFNKTAKYFLSEMQADAKQRSITVQIASLPWAFRPLIDLMTRRAIGTGRALGLSMVAAVLALMLLGGAADLSLPMISFLFVTIEIALCAHDVVANGEISRAIRASPQKAHDIAALVYFVRIGFQVAGLGLVGFALSRYAVRRSFFPGLTGIAVALTVSVIATFFFSAAAEPNLPKGELLLHSEKTEIGGNPHSHDTRNTHDAEHSTPQQQNDCFFFSAAFIGIVSVLISSAPLLGVDRPHLLCILSAIAALIGTLGVEKTFGREIAMVNAYRMLTHMAQPDIRQTTFIFYTDPISLYPQGPNLDPFFYSAVLGTVARGSALVGVALYRTFLRDWSFRSVYRLVAQLSCCAQIVALPVYLRLFNAWPRLDITFILIEEAIRIIVKHLVDIPGMILLARCCRKGNDASVLALCGAARFLSEPVQLYTGILLLSALGVNPSSRANDGDHLQHLWKAKLFIAFLGLFPLLFLRFMIPPGGNSPTASTTTPPSADTDDRCSLFPSSSSSSSSSTLKNYNGVAPSSRDASSSDFIDAANHNHDPSHLPSSHSSSTSSHLRKKQPYPPRPSSSFVDDSV